jgi:hypothetical protein
MVPRVIGTYGSALLIVLLSVVLGRGVCIGCGHDGATWLSPAVGFAALMAICKVAIGLPGRGWTAVAVVVVLCLAALSLPARKGARWPRLIEGAAVLVPLFALTSIPFLAEGRT